MSKWVARAKARGLGRSQILRTELAPFVREAARSPESLQFAFESEGVTMASPPTRDEAGLLTVELLYRSNVRAFADRDLVERLMGLFLGEVTIALHGGSWAIYPGKHHVASPFVVELAAGRRYVEPLSLCTGLSDKHGLAGASNRTALVEFVRNLEERSFP